MTNTNTAPASGAPDKDTSISEFNKGTPFTPQIRRDLRDTTSRGYINNARTDTMKTDITNALTAALKMHNSSRDELGETIEEALEPLPLGTTIKTRTHKVERVRVYSDCRQGDGWPAELGAADTVLVDGMLIRDCDTDFWDNRNWQYRDGGLRRHPDFGDELKLAPLAVMKSLVAELPDAVGKWAAAQVEEAAQFVELTDRLEEAVDSDS